MTIRRAPSDSGRYHHGDLRRALLDAALEILQERGDLSLRAVARRAGVSHAAPYHHFADRRALVSALAGEGLTAFREALLAGARREADPHLRMLEVGVAYVRFAVENPAHFRLMFSAELADRSDDPGLQEAYDAAYAVLLDGVRGVLGEGAPDGAVSAQATFAWSLVHGLSYLILDNQVASLGCSPDEAEELARRVIRGSAPPRPGGVSGSRPPAG